MKSGLFWNDYSLVLTVVMSVVFHCIFHESNEVADWMAEMEPIVPSFCNILTLVRL